jgi:DNA-directed RNA polymerase sigma subunit (sigma70/sigma32)
MENSTVQKKAPKRNHKDHERIQRNFENAMLTYMIRNGDIKEDGKLNEYQKTDQSKLEFLKNKLDNDYIKKHHYDVLMRYIGIGCPAETFKSISIDYNLSVERIRQIYMYGMARLRYHRLWIYSAEQ